MSTVATEMSVKNLLIDFVTRANEHLIKDLSFLPDDKLNVSPMGCARAPLNFVGECAGFNMFVGGLLAGEVIERPSKEEREKFYASLDTREKAVGLLDKTSKDIVAALKEVDDSILASEVEAPWGGKMPIYTLVHAAASHMSYHDGQVNYIQSLYGDGENH